MIVAAIIVHHWAMISDLISNAGIVHMCVCVRMSHILTEISCGDLNISLTGSNFLCHVRDDKINVTRKKAWKRYRCEWRSIELDDTTWPMVSTASLHRWCESRQSHAAVIFYNVIVLLDCDFNMARLNVAVVTYGFCSYKLLFVMLLKLYCIANYITTAAVAV